MMFVSECCSKPLTIDYGSFEGNSYTIDSCSGCGKEVFDVVLVHNCCGLELCECEVSIA